MAKYTGLQYDVGSEHLDQHRQPWRASISTLACFGGLVAECMIGLMIAFVYRMLRDNLRCPTFVTAGLCVMIVLPIAYFGTAYIKLVGSFVFTSVIAICGSEIRGTQNPIFETAKSPPCSAERWQPLTGSRLERARPMVGAAGSSVLRLRCARRSTMVPKRWIEPVLVRSCGQATVRAAVGLTSRAGPMRLQ